MDFSSGYDIGKWREVTFPGVTAHTEYRLVEGGLSATARTAASALVFDLGELPCPVRIRWNWRIDTIPEDSGQPGRGGDDYPGRVSLLYKYDPQIYSWWERSLRFLQQKRWGPALPGASVEYVWTQNRAARELWRNPYTEKAVMVAVRNDPGRFAVHEVDDVCGDYRRAFGRDAPSIVGISVMTDADDTRSVASAVYGWIEIIAGPGEADSSK